MFSKETSELVMNCYYEYYDCSPFGCRQLAHWLRKNLCIPVEEEQILRSTNEEELISKLSQSAAIDDKTMLSKLYTLYDQRTQPEQKVSEFTNKLNKCLAEIFEKHKKQVFQYVTKNENDIDIMQEIDDLKEQLSRKENVDTVDLLTRLVKKYQERSDNSIDILSQLHESLELLCDDIEDKVEDYLSLRFWLTARRRKDWNNELE